MGSRKMGRAGWGSRRSGPPCSVAFFCPSLRTLGLAAQGCSWPLRWLSSSGWLGLGRAELSGQKATWRWPPTAAPGPRSSSPSIYHLAPAGSHFTPCLSVLIYAERARPLGSVQGTSGHRHQEWGPRGPAPRHEDTHPKKTYLGRCPAVTARGLVEPSTGDRFRSPAGRPPEPARSRVQGRACPGRLAVWPRASTLEWRQGPRLCGELASPPPPGLRSWEVAGLTARGARLADLALEARPSRCEHPRAGSAGLSAEVPRTPGGVKPFDELTEAVDLLPWKTRLLTEMEDPTSSTRSTPAPGPNPPPCPCLTQRDRHTVASLPPPPVLLPLFGNKEL
ncbi:zinc finger protein LOC728743 homolog isoform X2 [Phyllostomus hastatus]|uniref:zinc finger protein LOC728743 homolog isoform X2 n=1 Tax=Phyllostomus hastatus TaxID=9423 RepID=UPI001E684DBF|nr:zinc finger protein LOC728743 homolog isoform X2 [Phyllostomus hastatus]